MATSTRQDLRRHLAALLFSNSDYVLTTATAGAATTVTIGDYAGAFPNGSFVQGNVILRAGEADAEIRLITDYDGATGVITVAPAWDTNPVAADVVDVYKATVGVDQLHSVINDAISATQFDMPVTALSEFKILSQQHRVIDVPTGWMSVTDVRYDTHEITGDRVKPHASSIYRTERTLAATTTRRSQALQPSLEYPIAGVAVKLRRVGTLGGTLSASIFADSGGSITGSALATGTIAATSLPEDLGYAFIEFTSLHYDPANTRVHVVLSGSALTGLSASNYVALSAETLGCNWGVSGLSTDSGSTWTEYTDERLNLRLVPTLAVQDFAKLDKTRWRIIKGTTPQVQLITVPLEGELYRLEGQKYRDTLSLDTDTCTLPISFVASWAAGMYLAAMGSHLPDAERRSQAYLNRAERWLALNGSLVKQRLVEWY